MSRFIVIALFLTGMLANESGAVLIVRDTLIYTTFIMADGARDW